MNQIFTSWFYSLLDLPSSLISEQNMFYSIYSISSIYTCGPQDYNKSWISNTKASDETECIWMCVLWFTPVNPAGVCVCLCETFQIFLILFLPFIFLKRCCPDTSKSAHTHTHTFKLLCYTGRIDEAFLCVWFWVFSKWNTTTVLTLLHYLQRHFKY